MSGLIPRTLVIDDFLPADLHARLLDYILEIEDTFEPTKVILDVEGELNDQLRVSLSTKTGLGPLKDEIDEQARAVFPRLCAATGVPEFEISMIEYELAAHGDGAFYVRHIDSMTGGARGSKRGDRILTAVYYFHREPKRFSGGNLAIFPFIGKDSCEEIEPRDNRLASFASIVPHEVRPISCPSDEFKDFRYALNMWFRRAQ